MRSMLACDAQAIAPAPAATAFAKAARSACRSCRDFILERYSAVAAMEGAREDDAARTEPQVLGQHVAARQHAFVEPRDAAEAESQALAFVPAAATRSSSPSGQRLEHEAMAQREMQVVQADIHLGQARRGDPLRPGKPARPRRFQQRHDAARGRPPGRKTPQVLSLR